MSNLPLSVFTKELITAILDGIVTLVLFFVGKYALGSLEDVKIIIAVVQPIAITLIGMFAYKDIKTVQAGLAYDKHSKSLYNVATGAGLAGTNLARSGKQIKN